jgi:hypothetical protein
LKGLSVSSLKYRPEPSWVRQFFADFVPTRLPTQLQLQQLVKQGTVKKEGRNETARSSKPVFTNFLRKSTVMSARSHVSHASNKSARSAKSQKKKVSKQGSGRGKSKFAKAKLDAQDVES